MKYSTPEQWGGEQQSAYFDGKFFQPTIASESKRRRETALDAVKFNRVALLGLNDYQRWVELDWKEQHYTVEAFERFEEGLIGEIIELDDEIDHERKENLFLRWESREELEKASTESISELGDVFWYGTAMLGNARIDLETCFREYLHDKWEPIEWGEEFTVGDVQARTDEHTPYPFSRRSVSNLFLEDVDEERAIARDMYDSSYTLAAILSRVFNRDRITPDPRNFLQTQDIEAVGGLFVAFASYHASKTLGSSLEQVIGKNIEKISLRAKSGHIDKQDGVRSHDER